MWLIAGNLQALAILLMAPLSSAASDGNVHAASSSVSGTAILPNLIGQALPSSSLAITSRYVEDVVEAMDKLLNINNLTVTVAAVCDTYSSLNWNDTDDPLKTCDKERIYKKEGTSLKPPFQDRGVLCKVTAKKYKDTNGFPLDGWRVGSRYLWEFIPSSDSRTCDFNCDCEGCWDEALCQWMENTNTTRDQFIEKGGGLTGEGILCKLPNNQWEHLVRGDRRICDGYTDCVNRLDEQSCPVLHVKVDSLEANITQKDLKEHRGARTKGGIVCKDNDRNWIAIVDRDPRICNGINECFSSMPVSLDEENCDMFHIKAETRQFNLTPIERLGPRKGAFRDEGLVCEDKGGRWIFLRFSQPERCDGLFLCKGDLDEANCSNLLGKTPAFIALGILVVCLLAHMLRETHYRYSGGSTATDNFAKQFSQKMRTPLDEAVDTIIEAAQIKGRERDGSTESDVGSDKRIDSDILEAAFSQVHAAEAGSKLLIGAGFTFLLCPHARHWLAKFILEQEQKIHKDNQDELLTCLRTKAASNAGTTEFLDSIQPPGLLSKANLKSKAKMAVIVDVLLEQNREEESSFCGTMVNSAKSTLFRFWPLFKTTAYLMDYIKDGCMFAYLLQRFKFVLASCSFLRGLIVFHGVSVVTSGFIVGLAIQDSNTIVNLDGIRSVYTVWLLRFFFFICTPLMPLAIIFMAISLTEEKKRLEATWRKVKDTSASIIWRSYDLIDVQKRKVMTLFSYMKTIEASTEASFQLFSLVVFIIASVMLPAESGLTFGLDDSALTWPFLILSLLQSYSSIINSILSAVNIEKSGGLTVKNKIFLGLSISLQMLARLLLMVPIAILTLKGGFGVMEEEDEITADLMDIRRKRSTEPSTKQTGDLLSPTTASLLLILPLVIHWVFLILLYARLNIVSFWSLSKKDKLLHLLSNTMVTLPVRKTQEGTQVHKGRETFWSLVLVATNLLATALITSALVNKNIFTLYDSKANVEGPHADWVMTKMSEEGRFEWLKADKGLCDWLFQIADPRRKRSTDTLTKADLFRLCEYSYAPTDSILDADPIDLRTLRRRKRSTDVLASIFLENIDGSGVKYYKPRFFFAFGLPSLLCHLVGSFLLLLQYKLVHPWRQLGREREANLWGKLGGTKRGMNEEMSHWRSTDKVIYEKLYNIENLPFVTQI